MIADADDTSILSHHLLGLVNQKVTSVERTLLNNIAELTQDSEKLQLNTEISKSQLNLSYNHQTFIQFYNRIFQSIR